MVFEVTLLAAAFTVVLATVAGAVAAAPRR